MKVWEVDDVPTVIQAQAQTVYQAKREALQQIAKDSKAMAVYILEI